MAEIKQGWNKISLKNVAILPTWPTKAHSANEVLTAPELFNGA